MNASGNQTPPILSAKDHASVSVFKPENLLREARRQKSIPAAEAPDICVLDPDGDIVDSLIEKGAVRRDPTWACYHSELHNGVFEGIQIGFIGRAVGAPFAVLLAEQLFAAGCKFLVSVTSAGQLCPLRPPPYFVLIDRALRDEGTSYHYLPASEFSTASKELVHTPCRRVRLASRSRGERRCLDD